MISVTRTARRKHQGTRYERWIERLLDMMEDANDDDPASAISDDRAEKMFSTARHYDMRARVETIQKKRRPVMRRISEVSAQSSASEVTQGTRFYPAGTCPGGSASGRAKVVDAGEMDDNAGPDHDASDEVLVYA